MNDRLRPTASWRAPGRTGAAGESSGRIKANGREESGSKEKGRASVKLSVLVRQLAKLRKLRNG
jgi:hypothetical protein